MSRGRQHVSLGSGVDRMEFVFEDGETIWTESSYKYAPRQIAMALGESGFRAVEQWIDEAGAFALTLVETA